jgi:uncharacterized membrane protein
MAERLIQLSPEKQKDILAHHIWSANRLTTRPNSGITSSQVSTVIDHMFAAATYWMTVSGMVRQDLSEGR